MYYMYLFWENFPFVLTKSERADPYRVKRKQAHRCVSTAFSNIYVYSMTVKSVKKN